MNRAGHLVSAIYIFVVIILLRTSKFTKCQDFLVLFWESGWQREGVIIYYHFCCVHSFIHSFINPGYTHPVTRPGPGVLGTLRQEAGGSPLGSGTEDPAASRDHTACRDWRT